MSTLALLFLLLVVAYLGGFLMGDRGTRGLGLPSGAEWLVAGFVLGPAALRILSADHVATFAPLALVAIGWMALYVGLHYGTPGDRFSAWGLALGLASGLLGLLLVGGAVWLVLERVPAATAAWPSAHDRMVLSAGIGAALAGTTARSVRWAVLRLGARGPLAARLAEVSHWDDLVPVLAVGLLVGLETSRGVRALPLLAPALGAALGVAGALLLGRTLRPSSLWGLLLGLSLVATGAAVQLDLSVISTLFFLGWALAAASPLRHRIRELSGSVEGPLLITALFIAGFRVSLAAPALPLLLAAALAARTVATGLTAAAVAATTPAARRAGPPLGVALFSTGPVGVAIALSLQLRFPDGIGDAVLAVTAATAVASEFVGPPALRAALRRSGEVARTPEAR